MLLWIISLLTLGGRGRRRHSLPPHAAACPGVRHRVFIVAAAATDALPAVIAVAGVVAHDNTTAFMTFAMWAFWAWMVTVLPRMACYFFRWIGLPRVGIAAGAGVAALFVWGRYGRAYYDPRKPHGGLLRTPPGRLTGSASPRSPTRTWAPSCVPKRSCGAWWTASTAFAPT